jgi:hypothetical protein
VRYWDSSALLVLHLAQPASLAVRDLFARDPQILTWTSTELELRSAIERLRRESVLDDRTAERVERRLDATLETAVSITAVDSVKRRARRLLAIHDLRAADALQLGAALTAVYDDPSGWEFVCLDERLGTAASREGFTVVP